MHDLNKFKSAFEDIICEWNSAEKCIKQSEQINHAVVFPAVKELRYAGRQMIDALQLIYKSGDESKISEHLIDAKLGCNRARHDAVDAGISKIAIDLDTMVKRFSPTLIFQMNPNYPDLISLLEIIQKKIVDSREHRADRDAIYTQIEKDEFPKIISLYEVVKPSAAAMQKAVQRDHYQRRIAYLFAAVGLLAAIFSLIVR